MRPSAFTETPHNAQRDRNSPRSVGLVFDRAVSMDEVEGTLELARLAAESLHGTEQVELDVAWFVDRRSRAVTVDTATAAGRTLALIFLGYARREFGNSALRVFRTTTNAEGQIAGAA
jgi:hypothetical protein